MQNFNGKNKLKNVRKILIIISVIALGVAIVVFGLYFWVFSISSEFSKDYQIWAGFGDYIGGVLSPILAFTALIALLYSIHIQSIELNNSANQLEKSAYTLNQQNELIQKERTEASFFQLLQLYNEIVQQFYLIYRDGNFKDQEVRNRQCIDHLANKLKQLHHSSHQKLGNVNRQQILDDAYTEFNLNYGNLLGHYFRTIIVIIEFVDNAKIDDSEKIMYINILLAQLSRHELSLIFYHILSGCRSNHSKIVSLVKKYRLLMYIESCYVLTSPEEDGRLMNIAISATSDF